VWHRYCFYAPMTILFAIWLWLRDHLGGGKRSLMPGFVVLSFGYADRWLHVGRPSNLTVLARRMEAPATPAPSDTQPS
jgi:hypothetical protein